MRTQIIGKPEKVSVIVSVITILQIVAAVVTALEAIIRFVSFITALRKTFNKKKIGFVPPKNK
jgi:hypothetical protein